MRPIRRSTLFAFVFFLLSAGDSPAQQPAAVAPPATGSLRVVVRVPGNSQPVSGIQVILAPLPAPSATTPSLPETEEAWSLYLQNPSSLTSLPVTPRILMSAAEARVKLREVIQQAFPQNTGVGEVSGVGSEPRLLQNAQPEYSDEARQNRVQGTIEILFVVKDDGAVGAAEVIRGLGYGLDEKAVDAVKRWRFSPATKDGKPVFVFISALVNFSLRGSSPLRTAVTDANGIAAFTNLAPARFAVSATHNDSIGVTSAVVAAPSQMAPNVPLLLQPAASVTGRLRDAAGAPVAGLRIALGVRALHEGRSIFLYGPDVVTDAQGEYRLTSVAAGNYYLRGQSLAPGTPPFYYPGTADMEQARSVSIQSGQAIVGIDFGPPK